MQILLNGATTEVADGITMAELVEQLALSGQRIAVEVNSTLVPRSRFAEHRLVAEDRVEVIHAVGGG